MAKKSMVERQKKRQRLTVKYKDKRLALKKRITETELFEEKLTIHCKLQALPRDSSPTRLHNRCLLTGRPKAYFRDFGVSRHVLREMAHEGLLPGLQKASW